MSTMGGMHGPGPLDKTQSAEEVPIPPLGELPDDVREMVAGALINTFRQEGALGSGADAAHQLVELEKLASKADIPDDDPEAKEAFVELANRMLQLGIISQDQLDTNIRLALKSRP